PDTAFSRRVRATRNDATIRPKGKISKLSESIGNRSYRLLEAGVHSRLGTKKVVHQQSCNVVTELRFVPTVVTLTPIVPEGRCGERWRYSSALQRACP